MTKAERLYRTWNGQVPTEARLRDVITVLDYYFPAQWDQHRSSHIVIQCERLKNFPDYQPYGELSIPVKGGQKVKGFYIKALVKAINLLKELGDEL
ncbi:MAG TPA: hypothetical protein PKM59_10980 [Thermodesulfobacteriota bacterium]|nr:hypothetical protein [Deltaproteobacteria bacterium]HNR13829.1 hypothetical protein [Thermodesulfobacteriota bacterium]HNU71510.1 hypothetical protein [Thermodesulfobacteriota bacterium]